MGMRRYIYDYFFLLLLSLALYGVLALIAPFAGVLVGALMCSITFYPMYARLERWMPNASATLRAALSDLIVTIFFVAPLFLLLWATYQESASLIPTVKKGISAFTDLSQGNVTPSMPGINHLREFLFNAFGVRRAQFQSHVLVSVNRAVEYASAAGTALATNTITFVLDLGVMLCILFFMFRDGETLVDYFHGLIPMREENKIQLRIRMRDMIIDVVRGWLLTSFIQGVVAIIGYTIVGTEGAVLLEL
jgi:predicted PurR-regulated permease PerM